MNNRKRHLENQTFSSISTGLIGCVFSLMLAGCENVRKLGHELMLMERSDVVVVEIANASEFPGQVLGVVLNLQQGTDRIKSADAIRVNNLGTFAFLVHNGSRRYVAAFADLNQNESYETGEPAWYYADSQSHAVAITVSNSDGKARTAGSLSPETRFPSKLRAAAQSFRNRRPLEEVIDQHGTHVALGGVADLNDPKFSRVRGQVTLWEPASLPIQSGLGIYFLEEYSPDKIPVLFVYGMSGSPQDWQYFFANIDRELYQPWFFFYPTGRRLDEMGEALNHGVQHLHEVFGFQRMDVVAHSMGGLVARSFIVKNVLRDGNNFIGHFITISTPWGGHETAGMGARHSPVVVPSWYDLEPGSEFQRTLYGQSLVNRVPHTLIYGYRASESMLLPTENDGSVSVTSQLLPVVVSDAKEVLGVDATHAGILSDIDVFEYVDHVLSNQTLGSKVN